MLICSINFVHKTIFITPSSGSYVFRTTALSHALIADSPYYPILFFLLFSLTKSKTRTSRDNLGNSGFV